MSSQGEMVGKGTASTSCLKQGSVPMNNVRVTPEATYEAVVADPRLFMSSLEKLHSRLGTKFMVPIVGGTNLDLHKLFVEVTSRGGIDKILNERKWREVTASFVFPPTATNSSFILRKYYFSLLKNYEEIYFFKTNNVQISPDSLQSPSARPGLILGETRRAQELQDPTFTPQPMINSEEPLGGAVVGSHVTGVIDGKFEDGYLVTVTIGSEQLKGVVYHLLPQNTVAHQTPQQSDGVHANTWNNSANSQWVTGGVSKRRRRRKKSEMKRRDPAHPKRNRSGYTFFFAEQYARLKPLHSGKDREISRMIGELWNKLNTEGKAVYQAKAIADKERYQTEMQDYKEKLRIGQFISNAVPLQQRLPEQNVDMVEALPIEEGEEDDTSDSSGDSSEPHDNDQSGETDPELEEPLLSPSVLNPNPNSTEMVMALKEKTDDVVMETSLMNKADEETVAMASEQN